MAAVTDTSRLSALCAVGLLEVLHKYDCGGLGCKPCQTGVSATSPRKLVRIAGLFLFLPDLNTYAFTYLVGINHYRLPFVKSGQDCNPGTRLPPDPDQSVTG